MVAPSSGNSSFDFSYNAFNGWFEAYSTLSFYLNDIFQVQYENGTFRTQNFSVNQGDTIRIQAYETNYDSQPFVNGAVQLSNFAGPFAIPEPANIALMGLGLVGFAASRRKSAKSKNA